MNIIKNVKMKLARKWIKEFSWIWSGGQMMPTFIQADKESFAKEGYSGNVYVYSVIKQIATKCASIQWTLYKVTDDKAFMGYRQLVKSHGRVHPGTQRIRQKAMEEVEHEQITQTLEAPNQIQSWSEFIESIVSYKEISGDSVVVGFGPTTGSNEGKFIELVPLPSHKVTVEVGNYPKLPLGYKYENMKGIIPPEQVIHMKYFNPLYPYIGLSPMEPALMSVTQSNNYGRWNTAITESMGKIPGILKIKVDDLSDEQEQQIRAKYFERQAGRQNAGMPFITNNEIDWIPTAYTPNEMDWIKGIQMTANQIALAYDWLPELMGDSSQKTHANMRDAIKHAYNGKIIPVMDSIRDSFNKQWISKWRDDRNYYYIDYNLEAIEALQADRALQSDRAVREWTAGIRSLNEARWEIGLDEVDGGDVRQVPIGLLGIDDFGGLMDDEADKAHKQLISEGIYEYIGDNGH